MWKEEPTGTTSSVPAVSAPEWSPEQQKQLEVMPTNNIYHVKWNNVKSIKQKSLLVPNQYCSVLGGGDEEAPKHSRRVEDG